MYRLQGAGATLDTAAQNVAVLGFHDARASENHARGIAEFLGAEVTVVSLAAANDIESMRGLIPERSAIIVHVETLARIAGMIDSGISGVLSALDAAPHAFVYGFEPMEHHASMLQALSLGTLTRVESLPAGEDTFEVAGECRERCGPFSGLAVRGANTARDACFEEGKGSERLAVLMRAGGRPFFVRVDHGEADVYLVACSELANLDEKVPKNEGLLSWFSRLIPLAIFLRSSLGRHVWHSDCFQACVIIDDPLLQPRYGFLEYAALQNIVAENGFSTCIAFIPWNYRRSSPQVTDLFSKARGSLSLCIHGCDHTGAEFATGGAGLLRWKAARALERMELHGQLFGLPFSDVMVFPQGKYSPEALEALDACEYLAAVNTHTHPSVDTEAIPLRHLLGVAMTMHSDFPLFVRHYPREVAEFAFDLFWGKPLLVVEHHGYFRNGYESLSSFVRQLNQLDERLEWSDLTTICSRSCLKRVTRQGEIHVRFYTKRFRLKNSENYPQTYRLFRKRTSTSPAPVVSVNGREWKPELKHGQLEISLPLEAGEKADIRVTDETPAASHTTAWRPGAIERTRVLIRRLLCEVRDNHVDPNPLLSGILSRARGLRAHMDRA